MDRQARKAAIAACKEKKSVAGIYSLTCRIDGRIWVGETRNLEAQQNQVRFAMANGGFLNRDLREAVCTHGAAAFAYDVRARLNEPEEGLDSYSRQKWLREQGRLWREKLAAQTV